MAALDAYLTDRADLAGLGSPAQLTAPLLASAIGGGCDKGTRGELAWAAARPWLEPIRFSGVPAGPQPAHWYDRNNSATTAASGALTLRYTYRTQVRRASSPPSAIQTGNSSRSVRGQA